ncbi:MAG TPA: HlyD family efflux transporter periplasmic adaptor subunit [Candidatus Acidoferrales bacterium]|nr:HlyD family efflux transporter periplasmic adaptor subunit [Candidatus Acidoferrales bacterium]
MKKAIYRLIGVAILAGAVWGGYRFFQQLPARQEQVPTTKVQRGDVVIRAYSRGELRAVRSVTLTAPNLFGTVQTTRLAPMGSLAKEKDLVVEYDDSERKSALEEAQLSVESVDEQIKKAKADLAIQQSQDAVTLLKTRYDVRRAELEVQRNPIISAIDGKKNVLTLEQSKRALQQLESDIQSRQEQADSALAVFQEQRNRSLIDVQRELQRIAQTKTLAPITGLVAIKQNRAGNFNFGQQLPDIREGDTLQPGMPVVDVLDLSELEVWAKVGELDRANLKEGQDALLQLDAIPEKRFQGKIKAMSGTATSDVFSGDPSKKFDVVFSIDMRQLLAGLGMKQTDVDRIMRTAESNARKNVVNSAATLSSGRDPQGRDAAPGAPGAGGQGSGGVPADSAGRDQGGGFGPGGMPGPGGRGGQGPGARGQGTGAGGGQGGRGGATANLSDQDRQKVRDAMQKAMAGKDPASITPEDRQKMMQDVMTKSGMAVPAAGLVPSGRGLGTGGQGPVSGRDPQGRDATQRVATTSGLANPLDMMRRTAIGPYTEEERNNAKLPLPPEQDSQVQVLLRPGLLADVEIQVEKLPDVIHVPAQAVFDKNGKHVVFVQKNRKFEAREVQLVKQSESLMVLAGGVQAGEVVALADPTADKKSKSDKKSSGGGMSGMPGGK